MTTKTVRSYIIFLLATLPVLCAVTWFALYYRTISAAIVRAIDQSPPRASFFFTTSGGPIAANTITILPGETFTPVIEVSDNFDSTPTIQAWISKGSNETFAISEGDIPVTSGSPISIDEAGPYFLHAQVTDAAGNQMVWGTIVNVFDKPNGIELRNDEQISTTKGDRNTPDAVIRVDAQGVHVEGAVSVAESGNAAIVVERIEINEERPEVSYINATLLLGAKCDLSKLDLSFLLLSCPADNDDRIKETSAEYLPDSNVWRISFEGEFLASQDQTPSALRLSGAIKNNGSRSHFFCDTAGIEVDSMPMTQLKQEVEKLP